MFFRRFLERKDNTGNINNKQKNNSSESDSNGASEYHVIESNESVICDVNATSSEGKDNNNNNNSNGINNGNNNYHMNSNVHGQFFKMQRAQGLMSSSLSAPHRKFINTNGQQSQQNSVTSGNNNEATVAVATGGVQLSPLWEHVLRTRRLPETICPASMFAEFQERLQDPEWQVRQHALRVLVDVLIVMGSKADNHMDQLTTQLVENLGHQAPTVRKGALDCLRVYLAETAMPETIMLHILHIGLSRQLSDEPFGGRLTCGVMLSLPALLQSILHTTKRHFILRTTIDMLVSKMSHVMQQEITLKVLTKISELIGRAEFEDYMSPNAMHEFVHLSRVYGIEKKSQAGHQSVSKTGAWRALQNRDSNWRPPKSDLKLVECPDKGKVIMETEIQVNDETLTMRILEADTDAELESPCNAGAPKSIESDIVCRPLPISNEHLNHDGILGVISDSEVEEPTAYNQLTPLTPSRSLKRVTFGGEIVKMRTPDSDASNTNAAAVSNTGIGQRPRETIDLSNEKEMPAVSILSPISQDDSKTTVLTLDIPSDNTKPLPRPKSAQSPQRKETEASLTPGSSSSPGRVITQRNEPITSLTPRSPYKCKTISPVDSICSPKAPHKEIEVLHNLQQRDPSPISTRTIKRSDSRIEEETVDIKVEEFRTKPSSTTTVEQLKTKTWEELDIVDYKTLLDLRSGDWRNRLQGISQLELALRSSATLARLQPYLDSLLRTLLSSERNYEVAELKRDLLINLITRLPLDNLEDRTPQILSGLCRQSNAGANRVCKALMQRLPAGTIVAKLSSSEFLHAKSSKFREHAIQIAIYALMTFPSTCFDTTTCTLNAVYAALNRKRRVRQAALEMIAVVGEIANPNAVLEITEQIAEPLDEGASLLNAVRKRLARKQLPHISLEGAVLYALQHPSGGKDKIEIGTRTGSDMDWISMGEAGSASPNALKRRRMRCASKQNSVDQLPGVRNTNYHSDESLHRHSFHSPPEAYDFGQNPNNDNQNFNYKPTLHQYGIGQNKPQAIYTNFKDRHMMHKTCSDSSMDGRSTDSTNTCSSGSGSFIQISGNRDAKDGINGRFTRQTSRFPTMNHLDLRTTYRIQRPSTFYPGMGPYAQLQQQQMNMSTTYPKINYGPCKQQHRKKFQPSKHNYNIQDNFKTNNTRPNQYYDVGDIMTNSYTICQDLETMEAKSFNKVQNKAKERFINVKSESLIQSTKPSQNASTATLKREVITKEDAMKEIHEGSPISTKSMAYSQKSTASAKSSTQGERTEEISTVEEPTTTAIITTYNNIKTSAIDSSQEPIKASGVLNSETKDNIIDAEIETQLMGVLVVDDLESEEANQDSSLKRNESLNSLHSKSESIKTQLEDTPQTLSRAQSVKSLAIEEEIDDNNSFVVVEEELLHNLNAEPLNTSRSSLQIAEKNVAESKDGSAIGDGAPRHSRSNSLDSLYERPSSKQGSLDTTTTDYSSQTSSQLNNRHTALSVKSLLSTKTIQHTPLKEKSKTSIHLRNHRRISPVKQAIKMSQPELYPQNMDKFEKPREALLKTFDQLDSSEWEVNMNGLKAMVRLIRYHSEHLDNQMHMVCIQLTRSVRNLRSQVARAACQAATELFELKSKYLETECDDLVFALLQRTADTNRFIRTDATRALEAMCDNLPAPKVLNILANKGVQHQNAVVRTTAAKLLNRLVERLGCDRIFAMSRENRDKFFLIGANLLLEGSLETRSNAKSVFRKLSQHASYNRLINEIIPMRTFLHIEKTLKNITR